MEQEIITPDIDSQVNNAVNILKEYSDINSNILKYTNELTLNYNVKLDYKARAAIFELKSNIIRLQTLFIEQQQQHNKNLDILKSIIDELVKRLPQPTKER